MSSDYYGSIAGETADEGAAGGSERRDLQPGTGQSARHWRFGSRCALRFLRASHQWLIAQSSALGSPRPQAIDLSTLLRGE